MAFPQPQPKPVLVISGGPVTQSLWPGLAEKYDLCFLQPQPSQLAAELALPAFCIPQLVDDNIREKSNNRMANLTAALVAGMPAIAEQLVSFLPPTHPPALNSQFTEWFAGYIAQHLSWEAQYIGVLDLVASQRKIAGCLVHEDVGPDTRLSMLWAKAHALPTIHLPHANCHLLPGVRDIHRETRTDWILAHGDYMREFYAQSGFNPEHIVVVGNPACDALYGSLPAKSEARAVMANKSWGDVSKSLWLCYATTWGQTTSLRSGFEKEFEAGCAAVMKLARDMGAVLEILVHRSSDPAVEKFFSDQMRAAGVAGLVTRQHFNYVVRAADAMIAQGPSNMCIEAAIMGVPSCYIQTEGFDYAHALPYRGPSEDLPEIAFKTLAGGADWQDFIAYYNAAHPHGGATEKALEMVTSLCP